MIHKLSCSLAAFVCKQDPDADYEVLAYGYEMLFKDLFIYVVHFLAALLLGVFWEVLMVSVISAALRMLAGGCHANSHLSCFISSTLLVFLSVYLPLAVAFSLPVVAACGLVSLVTAFVFAPADTQELPMRSSSLQRRKISTLAILAGLYALALLLGTPYSGMIATITTLICLHLTPLFYRLYRCKTSAQAAREESAAEA